MQRSSVRAAHKGGGGAGGGGGGGGGGEGCGTNVPKNDACQQMITIFKIEKKGFHTACMTFENLGKVHVSTVM